MAMAISAGCNAIIFGMHHSVNQQPRQQLQLQTSLANLVQGLVNQQQDLQKFQNIVDSKVSTHCSTTVRRHQGDDQTHGHKMPLSNMLGMHTSCQGRQGAASTCTQGIVQQQCSTATHAPCSAANMPCLCVRVSHMSHNQR
jgi:hypothetical protein